MNRVFVLPLLVLCLFTAAVLSALFFQLSPGEIVLALASEETRFALRLSLMTSITSILLALILGVPTGYFLARTVFPGKQILDTFLDLPLVIPPLVAGVGLLFLFGQDMLGEGLEKWGIHILFTPWGAILAQAFVACPIVMRTSRAAFERSGHRYEWAAATLGLRPSQVFFQDQSSIGPAGDSCRERFWDGPVPWGSSGQHSWWRAPSGLKRRPFPPRYT